MSQSGLLSEDEVRNYINESFNLKLDREAISKPTREIICEIYAKFLDDIYPKWPVQKSEEIPITFTMAKWIRIIINPYNIGLTLSMSDLLSPTRKRTHSFLNVLIFVRAKVETEISEYQSVEEECQANHLKYEQLCRELEQQKMQLEDALLKKASYPRLDALIKMVKDKRDTFEAAKKRCESLSAKASQIKSNIKALSEAKQIVILESETIKRETEEVTTLLQLIRERRALEDELSQLQAVTTNKEREYELGEGNLRLELEKQKALIKDTTERQTHEKNTMIQNIAATQREIAELESKLKENNEKCRSLIEQADKKVAIFQKRAQIDN